VHGKKFHPEDPVMTVDKVIYPEVNQLFRKVCEADWPYKTRKGNNGDFSKDDRRIPRAPLIGEYMNFEVFTLGQSLTKLI